LPNTLSRHARVATPRAARRYHPSAARGSSSRRRACSSRRSPRMLRPTVPGGSTRLS